MSLSRFNQSCLPMPKEENAWSEYLYTDFHSGTPVTCWLASAPPLIMSFDEAILAAGPKTGLPRIVRQEVSGIKGVQDVLIGSLIWTAGKLYGEVDVDQERVALVLAHFGKGNSMTVPTAIIWARSQGLVPAPPRLVFAVCAGLPELYEKLGCDPVGILSTEECQYDGVWRVPCVWQGSAQQECAFVPSRYPLHDSYCFAFRAWKI